MDCLTGVGAGSGGTSALLVSHSIFHQTGYSVPPAADATGATLTNGSPDLVNGLYAACTNGVARFGTTKWSAVFNRYNNNDAMLTIDNCMVGDIALEDTRTWDEALTPDPETQQTVVTGCRLFAGYDTAFEGADTVTRGVPVFTNTDPDSPNPFALAANSPGQGLGADFSGVFGGKLSISKAGNQVTISWSLPIWIKGCVLKSTASLTNPNWTAVAGVSNNSVTVTVGAGNQFFALFKQ